MSDGNEPDVPSDDEPVDEPEVDETGEAADEEPTEDSASDGEVSAEGSSDEEDAGADPAEEAVVPARAKGAAPSRPSTRKPSERPKPERPKAKASKGSRKARRRRFGAEEIAVLVFLLAFIAQIVNLAISETKASTWAWVLLAALGGGLVLSLSRLADKRGKLAPLRNRGLGALAVVLSLAAFSLVTVAVNQSTPQLGIDLRGGFSVTLTAEGDPAGDSVDQAVEIIRNRIDGLGVAEPEVTRQGDAVVVNLPGVQDRERALQIVGETAKLEFRPVLAATAGVYDGEAEEAGDDPCASPLVEDPTVVPEDGSTTVPEDGSTTVPADGSTTVPADGSTTVPAEGATTTAPADETATTAAPKLREQEDATTTTAAETTTTVAGDETTTTVAGETTTTVAGETTVPEDPTATTVPADDGTGAAAGPSDTETIPYRPVADEPPAYCSTVGPVGFEGSALSKAEAELGGQTGGEWVVAVRVKGSQQATANALINSCFQAAATCPTQQMAIVLDGEVISAPTVQNLNLADDEFVINGGSSGGGFPESEAKDLALKLRYGALPVEFRSSDEQQLSPSLGDDTLRAGILAGVVGLIAVALYLIIYYRALGVVVVMGLAVWSSLMYGVVCWLSATRGLTLSISGVVGIVVSLGTTVDSYVVHFERLKDEVRLGKSVRASTEKGFQKAFRTILTADLASLMGAVLLWYLTVGAVRGFAFFLGLSVVLDLFVAYCFDRPMVALLARSDFFVRNKRFGVARGLGREADDAPARAKAGAAS